MRSMLDNVLIIYVTIDGNFYLESLFTWLRITLTVDTMAIMATHTHCLAGTLLAISDFESKSEMDISDLTSATLSKSEM